MMRFSELSLLAISDWTISAAKLGVVRRFFVGWCFERMGFSTGKPDWKTS
jgi:hypothetical protein